MQRLGNWLSATGRDVLGQLAESVAPLFRSNLEQFQFAWYAHLACTHFVATTTTVRRALHCHLLTGGS
jgi:hypothetical protein